MKKDSKEEKDLNYLNDRAKYEYAVVEANKGLDVVLAEQRFAELKKFDSDYKMAGNKAIDLEIQAYCKTFKMTFKQVCYKFKFDEYFMNKVVLGLITVDKKFVQYVIYKLRGECV